LIIFDYEFSYNNGAGYQFFWNATPPYINGKYYFNNYGKISECPVSLVNSELANKLAELYSFIGTYNAEQ